MRYRGSGFLVRAEDRDGRSRRQPSRVQDLTLHPDLSLLKASPVHEPDAPAQWSLLRKLELLRPYHHPRPEPRAIERATLESEQNQKSGMQPLRHREQLVERVDVRRDLKTDPT